jgi:formate hydrogenlyase transcriptional activator
MNLNLNTTIPKYPVPKAMLQRIAGEAAATRSRVGLELPHLLAPTPERLQLPPIGGAESFDNGSCDFNALLEKIVAGFTSCAADQVGGQAEAAFHLVCEFFQIERAALWNKRNVGAEGFLLRYVHSIDRGPSGCEKISQGGVARLNGHSSRMAIRIGWDSAASFPWLSAQVQAGNTVILENLKQLPADAAHDREALARLGISSCLVIPFLAEGKAVGAASFARTTDHGTWPDTLVESLRLATRLIGIGMLQSIRHAEVQTAVGNLSGFKAALDKHAMLATTDLEGRITYANDKFCAISKFSREELLGEDHRIINSGHHPKEFFQNMWSTISKGHVWQGEIKNRAKDGSYYWEATTIVPLLNESSKPRQYISIRADVTEQKLAQEALLKSCAEIKQLKDRLEAESAYLQSEIRVSHPHGHIIGHSACIKKVLHQVEQVAPVECAVLLTGETGTGKELIAQEIHRLSRRGDRLMVLVNCAALPTALVESELFGRERGAYTGALTAQAGRFQIADNSTIFLDEVGELSTEVQAKLLRVLQQGEFQRLGNPKTHKVDVRVIAATNRDLADEVRKGRFREDLYYRLKVFPIELPPLRERVQDIPALVFAFVEEFSMRMGKKVTKVPRNAMEKLQGHSWPGNIRELRNVIEHSVILTSGDTLKLSVLSDHPVREAEPVTLAEAERQHILKALESTGWRIKGPHGAAQRLDLEPSTLYSRMQKLSIPNRRQKDEMAMGEPGTGT